MSLQDISQKYTERRYKLNAHSRTCNKLQAIDLFCGCGGLSLGLQQAGFNVIGAVDIDSLAIETYKLNHRNVKVWETDINKLPVRVLMHKLNLHPGDLDLLAGCPPCQGYSKLRTLNGKYEIDDPRNDLVFCFLDYVLKLRPKTVMMENVPGLATDYRMKTILFKMRRAGYHCDVKIVDAAKYGVPQRRHRMILLASQTRSVQFATQSNTVRTVRDVIERMPLPGKSGDLLHDFKEVRSNRIMERIKKIPLDGGSRSDLSTDEQLDCHKRYPSGFKDVYGRISWDSVAPTITSGCINPSKGRFLHPIQHRAITLREAAMLQTFPRNYQFSLRRGKNGAALLIGNALPPELIRRQAAKIALHLKMRSNFNG